MTSFVIDYLHLVSLGVVRKLLKYWLCGPLHKGNDVARRLPAQSLQLLSDRLVMLSNCIPQEFARRPRAVSEVDCWKPTEFRQFRLYSGPATSHGIPPDSIYYHFMLLSVAVTLLI